MRERDISILAHMIEYCDRLQAFTKDMDFETFNASELHKDACSLCIIQIGELVYNLTDETKRAYPDMPWRQIRSMRNIVAHHYGIVDAETLWDVIVDDIPRLKAYCERIRSEMTRGGF